MNHPIGELMQSTLENIRGMVDVNTVVGDPIDARDGSTVIPLSRVSFGFVSGGGEYASAPAGPEKPFAGGSGAGVSVQPVGFLVVGREGVRVLPAQDLTAWERALNCAPQLLEDLKSLLQNRKKRGAEDGK